MKTAKKLFALLLALCLILSMAACEKKQTPASTNAPETTAAATDAPATEAPAPETTAAPGFALEEISVLDNDEVSIRITGMENDELWGPTLKVEAENKTDKKLSCSLDAASVNGVSYFTYLDVELPAGKKANDEINFSDEDLNKTLGDFTDLWLRFRVREADNWEADDLAREEVHLYPYGEAAASRYVYSPDGDDKVLVDNESFRVILTGGKTGDFWAYAMGVFVENKTDRTLVFNADDVSLNGYVCDPYWSVVLEPKTMSISEMAWSESALQENGITQVEELEHQLRIYDNENWLDGELFKAKVTLNVTSGDCQVEVDGNSDPGQKPEPTEPVRTDIPEGTDISPVVGSWVYRMNFKDAMMASGESEDIEESMGGDFIKILEELELLLTLDLNEDGSFQLAYDRDSAVEAVEGMKKAVMEILPKMLSEAYGISMEELNDMLKQQGTSMDELLAEMEESMDTEELTQNLEESSAKGSFAYEDGKLYLAAEDSGVSVLRVELEADELRVVEVEENSDEAFEGMEALYPMVFTRK